MKTLTTFAQAMQENLTSLKNEIVQGFEHSKMPILLVAPLTIMGVIVSLLVIMPIVTFIGFLLKIYEAKFGHIQTAQRKLEAAKKEFESIDTKDFVPDHLIPPVRAQYGLFMTGIIFLLTLDNRQKKAEQEMLRKTLLRECEERIERYAATAERLKSIICANEGKDGNCIHIDEITPDLEIINRTFGVSEQIKAYNLFRLEVSNFRQVISDKLVPCTTDSLSFMKSSLTLTGDMVRMAFDNYIARGPIEMQSVTA